MKASDGTEIGYLVYTVPEGTDLSLTGYFDLGDNGVAVATFGAPTAEFDAMIDEIKPYLETVRSI